MIRTSRTVDVDVPSFARKVLKPTNTMVQTDTWSGAISTARGDGDFEIDVKGAPVHVSGQMRIEPTADGGTRHEVQGKLDVKIPLIGGKVAELGRGPEPTAPRRRVRLPPPTPHELRCVSHRRI